MRAFYFLNNLSSLNMPSSDQCTIRTNRKLLEETKTIWYNDTEGSIPIAAVAAQALPSRLSTLSAPKFKCNPPGISQWWTNPSCFYHRCALLFLHFKTTQMCSQHE